MSEQLDVHAWIDNEVSGEEKQRIEALMATRPDLRHEAEWVQITRTTLQTHCKPIDCEQTLAACRARLAEIDRASKVNRFFGKYSWALAGAAVATILVAGISNRAGGGSLAANDVAQVISASLPTSFNSSRQDELAGWLRRHFNRPQLTVRLGDLRPIEASEGSLQGRRIVRMSLVKQNQPYWLVMVEQPDTVAGLEPVEGHGDYAAGRFQDVNCVTWNSGEFSMFLVADQPVPALVESARQIRIE